MGNDIFYSYEIDTLYAFAARRKGALQNLVQIRPWMGFCVNGWNIAKMYYVYLFIDSYFFICQHAPSGQACRRIIREMAQTLRTRNQAGCTFG